jgi:hypothetical protein
MTKAKAINIKRIRFILISTHGKAGNVNRRSRLTVGQPSKYRSKELNIDFHGLIPRVGLIGTMPRSK